MTAKVVATLVVVAGFVGIVVAGYVLARRGSRGVAVGQPDRVTDDIVTGLMRELRNWQAEAAYWKATAERLQREADRR